MATITHLELLDKWKSFYKDKGLKSVAPYETHGDIPYSYVLPKFKDIERMRPIVSYKKHPLRKVFNIAARALTFLLKSCTDIQHLTLWETNHLLPQIEKMTDQWMDKKFKYLLITGDIKNMFAATRRTNRSN